jgi:uncharacterized protein (TIGR03382 family)
MLSNRISKLLLSGAVVAGMAGAVNAGLNLDIRATGVSGGPGTITAGQNGHQVEGVAPGTVIAFDIFAVVTGTNATATDDRFISVAGSVRSSLGGLLGNLTAQVVPSTRDSDGIVISAGFDGLGSSNGTVQDLDGDTDLDVGSNVDSNANDFWAARYALAPNSIPSGSTNPTSGGRKIGFGTFTVTGLAGQTAVNFDGRGATTAANYVQDNATVQEPSADGIRPLLIIGGTIPEPATLSLAALSALGLVRRRRA